MQSPEILTQNRPKYMKLPKILPEIWTPYTKLGPPTSYAYGVTLVSNNICEIKLKSVCAGVNYKQNRTTFDPIRHENPSLKFES